MEVDIGNVGLKMIMSIAIVMVVGLLAKLYGQLVVKPKSGRSFLKKQGINGPPARFLLGNLLEMKAIIDSAEAKAAVDKGHPSATITHNWNPSLFPFLHQWTEQYGDVFAYSLGLNTVLHVTKPALLKEITTNTSWDLGRQSSLSKEFGPLLGEGIIASNGHRWASQRKLLAPHLYLDKVKGMINVIAESSNTVIELWMNKIKNEGGAIDINIEPYMRSYSGDVICKACFGSNYSQSEEIFLKIKRLEEVSTNIFSGTGIPGIRYIPTKKNMEAWALEKQVYKLIMKIVNGRREEEVGSDKTNKDLLQMVLESAESSDLSKSAFDQMVVDNIKNLYLAGFDSSAATASWCLMLLASNPEWQNRVRAEVLQVCNGGKGVITSNMLLQMKELTMVIYETLRLYPPVAIMGREVLNDMNIGGIDVVKGMQIWSYVLPLHTDPDIWGPDSFEFNPQRFVNGVTAACKFPHLYMPFGHGPRVCLGQQLAMTELKYLVSSIVANFSFTLSPNYVHCLTFTQVGHPKFGVNLVLNKL